jgi:DNA repair exonuclease SbcCD ATPase subunit
MNFKGLIKRDDNVDDKIDLAFEELQFEMAEAFDESLGLEDPAPPNDEMAALENSAANENEVQPQESLADETLPEPVEVVTDVPETTRRLTSHTQSRLAALSSFDQLYHEAHEHLQEIGAKLSEVTISHNLTREFFNILHADIHRSNELELANANLIAEQRKLTEQLHDAARREQERENAIESFRQHETALLQDKEALRAAVAAAKLELVEANNTIARNEAELGDLVKTLSSRTLEAERRGRENDVLREKHVNLSIDLDKALKRESEARRKLDEVSTIHANEAARHTEVLATLGKSEKEVLRLQKALEAAQAKHAEMAETARSVEADREAEVDRSLAEMRGLRSEIQNLQQRQEAAADEQNEAASEIARLRTQLSDALAEKHVADERLVALMKENENDKINLSAASANISQLSLQHASEQIQLDIHRQECEDLRAEIAALNARIKELLPYERLYRVMKSREQEQGGVAEVAGASADTSRRKPATRRIRPQGRTVTPAIAGE